MKVIGNVLDITTTRDSRHKDVEVYLDSIEYLTSKKDGRYYQDFEYLEELETPLVITGDCLARVSGKKPDDGEYEFKVFDKEGEEYVHNPNKQLFLTLEYDFDENLTILSSAYYSVSMPNEEFTKFKTEREKEKSRKNWKGRKKS
ncbi:hypothetical protein [Rufibacter tibetensis]|uniref:Uncharacterized protein n=1 Tax=Rufibacter tibetensis TaxID=512763 RepID=A0A0P0C3W3_9BACT|nr:hypothetical protein [Rufibacter tibetensis]ALI97765.1 hypothetical protein DC20_00615 [Rufibacter tibetensis]